MAPSHERKTEDDFIYTISDTEEGVPDLDGEVLASLGKEATKTNSKKRKREVDSNEKTSGNKKEKSKGEDSGTDSFWRATEADDGAMDSDFEFELEQGVGDDMGEFEGWDLAGQNTPGIEKAGKKGVDLDEIISRRRDKGKSQKGEENDAEELELDSDAQDEFMAEDGFGMGIASDEEEEDANEVDNNDEESSSEEDDDLNGGMDEHLGSDSDSLASAVPHPDDLEDDDSSADEDQREDPKEAAKRKAFFAHEDELPKKSQSTEAEKSSFRSMPLSRPIYRGLATLNFADPTPIQAKTIPLALLGKDIVGSAATGSGKTAAFMVPILERLLYRPKKIPTTRVIILMPTRELAIQCHSVATKLASHTDIKFCLAVGGLSLKIQEAELRLRPDVVIATPGRFIDHMRNSASFTVESVEILVLDEADRMLEDGFADELDEILRLVPKKRQTMLFSATMTSSVDRLIRVGMDKPVRIMIDAQKQTVGTLVQEFIRLRAREEKRMAFLLYLVMHVHTERVIVFFRQKKEAHRARIIFGLLGLQAAELHGSMSQEQRISAISSFRTLAAPFLLATDLASRGLDIPSVHTVINYSAPQSHSIYLHRVGRTARAGRSGRACTLAAEADRKLVKELVKHAKTQGAKVESRICDIEKVDALWERVKALEEDVDAVEKEEREEKQLTEVEREVRRVDNLVVHKDEIAGKPKRTWFVGEEGKKEGRNKGRVELNGEGAGAEGGKKQKKMGKLSGKQKKRLDATNERKTTGVGWKKRTGDTGAKGRPGGGGKGVKKVKGGKPGGKKGGGRR